MNKYYQTPLNRLIGAVTAPKLTFMPDASSARGPKPMSTLPNPNDPRHARMFELLRQTEQAAYTADRLNMTAIRELDDRIAQKIKETATRSLRFSDFTLKKR